MADTGDKREIRSACSLEKVKDIVKEFKVEGLLEGSDAVKQGSIYEEFKDWEETMGLIRKVPRVVGLGDQIAEEVVYYRFLYLIDEYQEQPHLLDPHLESMLGELLCLVKDTKAPPRVAHLAFKFMYILTKTRGFKVIVRLMPHEVADVEPVLAMLNKQDKNDHETWESRYMLLIWLSIVCMIPFDMKRLDSNAQNIEGHTKEPIMDRIINITKKYLDVADKSRDAAAYALSRFMTRPDVKKERLPEFLDWSLKITTTPDDIGQLMLVTGVLTTLSLLFKHGKREDLVEYAGTILEQTINLKLYNSPNTVLRKMSIKLVQRLGLTFLKARIATWRYQRGSRSITDNLLVQQQTVEVKETKQEEEEEEYDIAPEIEDVIEQLLMALQDPNTIVRWSAAKGVGRLTGRLPLELADEIVESLMSQLFTVSQTNPAWHGGCLAIAELGRRGLLLPQRLPAVVPVILKALTFEEQKGNLSIGANVRDAACYVCWAFARAYEPHDLKPYVNQIASAMLIVSLFDREVNVRRAASAAFQENVGRQGQFPHGIDILTTCDYFSVGNLNNCYLELSVFVAQFPEYTEALIDHLTKVKVGYWDPNIRELCAQGLHNLTMKAPEYSAKTALPALLADCLSMDVNLRQGAIMAAAHITHALAKIAEKQDKTITDMMDQSSVEQLKTIAQRLQDAKLFRGVGGELMRIAVCCLIEKLSMSKMPFHDDPVIGLWKEMLEDNLHSVDENIRAVAHKAIPSYFSEYYKTSTGKVDVQRQESVVKEYLHQLQSNVEATRCGFALSLGGLPDFMIQGKLDVILQGLITVIQEKDKKWAESRRDAINAIISICKIMGVKKDGSVSDCVCEGNIGMIYEALFEAMKDYTLDSRGDVGAWVREASMSALEAITSIAVNSSPDILTPQLIERVFCCLVQQAAEKIDRTRAHAGEIFCRLLYHEPEIAHIPHRKELLSIFTVNVVKYLNWAAAAQMFPLITELLQLPTYQYAVLTGLTVSVGGLTESLVLHSAGSLFTYLRKLDDNKATLDTFARLLTRVFADNIKHDRISVPMLKMLDQLFSNGCFNYIEEQEGHWFPPEMLSLCKQEINRSSDPQKILTSIDVFCGLLQFPEVRRKCLSQLVIFLCHRYPIIRRNTANKLYEATLSYGGIVEEEKLDDVMSILSETQWDEPVSEVRPVRNKICELLDIPAPVLSKPAAKKTEASAP